MKYCNHCGKELLDAAEICTSCGCRIANATNNDKPVKGKGLGFVLSFFLGVIGLLIAIFLGDKECKQTAVKTFVVCLIVKVVFIIIYIAVLASTLSSFY